MLEAPSVSLILPCWHDHLLAKELVVKWCNSPLLHEIWVAGISECRENVAELTALGARCTTINRPGRGEQMNAAAFLATGNVLLFHHLDSLLEPAHLKALRQVMHDDHYVGGAFHRYFDERHPHLRWLEPLERWHCRSFGTLYGDQSLFVRREVFRAMEGFADYPLMEDVDFSRRLRRRGRLVVLDPPMRSSPRRHLEYGAWRMTLMNMALLILYNLGVPPAKLHQIYYQAGKPNLKNSKNSKVDLS